MRISFSVFCICLCFSQSIRAESGLDDSAIRTAETLRDQALVENTAYELVESLTTEIGPRLAGSANDARAVAWAEKKFKAMGFDRVYTEPVTIPLWRRGIERAEVLGPFPQPLQLTQLGSSIGTDEKNLDAEVIEFADLAALSAASEASEASVRGKIAYISYRMARSKNGAGYGKAVAARRNGAMEAAKKGAVGLLIRSIGTDNDRLPHTGHQNYVDGIKAIPAAALSNPDADLLSAMLRRGQAVTVRLTLGANFYGNAQTFNVIGEITGRELPKEFVTLGGHLDSWDLGTGAIDDASGVAITTAAGALIAQAKVAPRRSIRVIAYGAEEFGVLGGQAYADAHGKDVGAFQLGIESDFGAEQIYALRYKAASAADATFAAIAKVLAPLGIAHETGGGPGPDIGPMAALGMPWAELAQDGTHYFDIHHTGNDTIDKVDAEALKQQVAAYAALVYLAADSRVDFGRNEVKPASH